MSARPRKRRAGQASACTLFDDGKLLVALRCIAAEVKQCGVPDHAIGFDDLVQIGAEAMLLKEADFDPSHASSLTNWARVCARNAMMAAREHCRRRAAIAGMQAMPTVPVDGETPSAEEGARQAQRRDRLHKALGKISAAERQLLAAVDLRELPIAMVAGWHGLAENTVSTRRAKALSALREAFGEPA